MLEMPDQWSDEGHVVVQDVMGFVVNETVEKPLFSAIGLTGGQNSFEGLGQVAGQALLGNVAGGAVAQRLDGKVLTAVRRHENDRHERVFDADGLHQFQPVHLRHEHVGDDHLGRLLLQRGEGFSAIGREGRLPAVHLLHDGAGQVAIHGRVVHHQDRVRRSRGFERLRLVRLFHLGIV